MIRRSGWLIVLMGLVLVILLATACGQGLSVPTPVPTPTAQPPTVTPKPPAPTPVPPTHTPALPTATAVPRDTDIPTGQAQQRIAYAAADGEIYIFNPDGCSGPIYPDLRSRASHGPAQSPYRRP
jgi:hypothetical protein